LLVCLFGDHTDYKIVCSLLRRERSFMMENSGPEFVGPPEPPEKLEWVMEAEGKTIATIALGTTSYPLGGTTHRHVSEALVLQFTDGTEMLIQPGSNLWKLSSELEAAGIDPSLITTDLILHWLS
jgi:hypothetical protein